MDCDKDELKATKEIRKRREKAMEEQKERLSWAIKVLEHKEDFIVPNSDMFDAVDVLVEYVKKHEDNI